MDIDTPIMPIRRRDGGEYLQGFLQPKTWRLNGQIYGNDKGSVHSILNNMHRSLHHGGVGASLFYKSDRYAFAQLAPGGFYSVPTERGLYEYAYNVDIILVSDPFSEDVSTTRVTGSRHRNSAVETLSVGGNFPASPVFMFVAGTWNFTGGIRVDNLANSFFFTYAGPIVAGQTLLIDCVAGSVLLQVGLTMVNAISYFAGNLQTFPLEPGGNNDLVINAPTLDYTIDYRSRYYV